MPESVRAALGRLERRTLGILLVYGAGKLAVTGTGLLAALYLLDRLFEPPLEARAVLAMTALVVFGVRVWKRLLLPLRRRPAPRDLAAMWERSHPDLGGLVATAVELPEAPEGTSPALLERARERAEQATAALQPKQAAPAGRARRSGLRGVATVAAALALGWSFPGESSVFLDRLLGGQAAWPSATTLVLLPPFLEGGGEAPELVPDGPERFRLSLANGSVVSLRLRADGKLPQRVYALVGGERRPMRPLGGGEFVLRMPPLDGSLAVSFEGGDDDDGRPLLQIEGGDPPRLRDWSVRVEAPEYTGVPDQDSVLSEFRVPSGTVLSVRFRTEPPAARVLLGELDGTAAELSRGEDGWWAFQATALVSGEKVVVAVGESGFRNDRAGLLRWQALADRAPRAAFLWPEESWATVAGGAVPLLVDARDDFGLTAVTLREGEVGPEEALPLDDPLEFRRFLVKPAPPLPADAVEGGGSSRVRFELRATDQAPPAGQESRASSPWVEVLTEAAFDQRHGQRMIRAREQVEKLLDHAVALQAEAPTNPRQHARRVRRELDGLQLQLERTLFERLYAGLDPAAAALRPPLDALLEQGAPEPGALVAALDQAAAAPLERSGLLLDLARAAKAARLGPAEDLARAVEAREDPAPPARELQAQLQAMLDILLAWEDFQSAVNLLRGLLDRQRTLYLRTKEASKR